MRLICSRSMSEKKRMLNKTTVVAPSRLHFGLFSIGDTVSRKFGGVGLMLDSPHVIVHAQAAESFSVTGPGRDSAMLSIQHWFHAQRATMKVEFGLDDVNDLPIAISVETLPPRHCGLGTGTQLACASATAVQRLLELPSLGAFELANSVRRGKRSGIGTHGFCRGGFLVDRGKLPTESLAPLDFQTSFPDEWSIITVLLGQPAGLSGELEIDAFRNLPDSTERDRDEMIEIVRGEIIPGVTQSNYQLFAEGVYRFGLRSGMMYADIQNGPYNGTAIESLIGQIRDLGIPAVGQSSWGPCVFAVARSNEEAVRTAAQLRQQHGSQCKINVTKANNQGARLIESAKKCAT